MSSTSLSVRGELCSQKKFVHRAAKSLCATGWCVPNTWSAGRLSAAGMAQISTPEQCSTASVSRVVASVCPLNG